jgi:hypothetical protein
VASQAQGADILEVALSATLGHRHNVIRIPQAFAGSRLQPPMLHQRLSVRATRISQSPRFRRRIHAATRTDPLVSLEHLLAHIARLGAKLPLVHAEF